MPKKTQIDNPLNLILEPIGKDKEKFKTIQPMYVYQNGKSGDGHIHLKGNQSHLQSMGFQAGAHVMLTWDKKKSVLGLIPNQQNAGYTVSPADDHLSIKVNKAFNDIGFIPQPPVRENAENSGVNLIAIEYQYDGLPCLIANFTGLVQTGE